MRPFLSHALLTSLLSLSLLLPALPTQAAGDLSLRPEKLPDLVLGTEDDHFFMSHKRYELETGKAYKLAIISSGQSEYAMQAPEFFASIFLRKVEAGGLEIKAISLTELEFEQEGEAELYFVPIKPGEYAFYAEGLEAKGMTAVFVVQ
ncbi:copper-binding protein [Balneatrix alpica]|uniref:Copper-binding protein n=1 Tax=Balneatrix alpica TaxID=75684 RepID=A0ABV5ZDH9_9GAMM|nr:copper-binding protein [Balneatrix alpica]